MFRIRRILDGLELHNTVRQNRPTTVTRTAAITRTSHVQRRSSSLRCVRYIKLQRKHQQLLHRPIQMLNPNCISSIRSQCIQKNCCHETPFVRSVSTISHDNESNSTTVATVVVVESNVDTNCHQSTDVIDDWYTTTLEDVSHPPPPSQLLKDDKNDDDTMGSCDSILMYPVLPKSTMTFHHSNNNNNSNTDPARLSSSSSSLLSPLSSSSSPRKEQPLSQQFPMIVQASIQDLIREQIQRALSVWDAVLRHGTYSVDTPHTIRQNYARTTNTTTKVPLPTSITHTDAMFVRKQLEDGVVVPIFHAYTIPEEQRLFDPQQLLIATGITTGGGLVHTHPYETPIRITIHPAIPGRCDCDDNNDDDTNTNVKDSRTTTENQSSSNSNSQHDQDDNNNRTQDENTTTSTTNTTVPQHTSTTTTTEVTAAATLHFDSDYMTTFLLDPSIGLARQHIYDPNMNLQNDMWTFSAQHTNELVHLINTPAEMIGEDVEVTPLLSNFGINAQHNDPNRTSYGTTLLTRRLSRGIVLNTYREFQQFPTLRTICMTGNRGIGKSYTLLFALQQAMLYNKMCVVLYIQKEQKAIICIRNQNYVYAWEGTTLRNTKAMSHLFANPNVLVLIDPIDVTDDDGKEEDCIAGDGGGTKYAMGARRLLYAASNHYGHYNQDSDPLPIASTVRTKSSKNKIQFEMPEKERYLSPHTEDELRIVLPYMLNVNNTTFDEAMQRTYDVGMIPKYVLNDVAYHKRKEQVEQYVQELQSDPTKMKQLLNWNGVIGEGDDDTTATSTTSTIDTNLEEVGDGGAKTVLSNFDRNESPDTISDTIDDAMDNPVGTTKTISMADQNIAATLPRQLKFGTTLFYKMGSPLPKNIDGTMILSLNAYERVNRAIPFKDKNRSSSSMVGYNGEHPNVHYMFPKLTVTSTRIYDTLIQHYIKTDPSFVIALWDKVGCGHHNGMKNCIANLFWQFVQHQRSKADTIKSTYPSARRNVLHPWKSYKLIRGKEQKANPMSEWMVPSTHKDRHVIYDTSQKYNFYEIKEIFKPKRTKMFKMIRLDQSIQNLIQFAGPGRVVYQIVTDDDINLCYPNMVRVLVYGRYLLWQQKVTKHHGSIHCNPNAPDQPLHWYFVVPKSSRSHIKWEQRKPMMYYELEAIQNESTEQRAERRTMNRHKDEINQCIQRNVVQHVLVMDLDNYRFQSSDKDENNDTNVIVTTASMEDPNNSFDHCYDDYDNHGCCSIMSMSNDLKISVQEQQSLKGVK
jgi:hypothetical protein